MNFGVFTPQLYSDPYMLDDIDLMSYNSSAPMMGGSIFSGGAMPMPMMGMGYDMQQYYDYMKKNQRFQAEYNIDNVKLGRNVDLRSYASMEAVKNSATALKDKIIKNEQDQIKEAYDKYVQTVALAYGDGDPKEIQARAKSLYAQMNGGVTLTQDLREYGHGSFTQGMLQSMTLGTYCRNSAEDNVAYTTNSPVATGEKTKQNIGRIAGAGVVGGIGYGVAKGIGKMAAKSGNPSKLLKLGKKAGVVGLCIGAGAALLSFLTGKVTT